MPFTRGEKKLNSNFTNDKSVCNKFQQPYRPFVPVNHGPPVGNNKFQRSFNQNGLNRQLKNKQHPNFSSRKNIQHLDWKHTNSWPMQRDPFHISNQYSEVILYFNS